MKYENKKIKDLCDFSGGSQPPKSTFINERRDGYIRLIQIRDRLNDNFITYIPEKFAKKKCTKDDILIGRYGPPIFQIFRGLEGAYNVALLKATPKKGIDADYLYYFLQQSTLLHYVESMAMRTAGQWGVDLDGLNEFPVKLPSFQDQKRIASVLTNIDSKIAMNNKINKELEVMSKDLYNYWFVQFDFPNEDGKPYKSFGGKMIYNKILKREIPEGWEIKSIFDAADVIYGYPYSTEPFDENVSNSEKPYSIIRIRDILENSVSAKTDELADNKYLTRKKDILIGMDGYFHMNFWSRDGDYINQRITRIRKTEISTMIIYYQIMPFIKHKEEMSKGSTVGHLSDKDLQQIYILIPNNKSLSTYFENILDMKVKVQNEIQELLTLRDELLPMLMNGQLIVK